MSGVINVCVINVVQSTPFGRSGCVTHAKVKTPSFSTFISCLYPWCIYQLCIRGFKNVKLFDSKKHNVFFGWIMSPELKNIRVYPFAPGKPKPRVDQFVSVPLTRSPFQLLRQEREFLSFSLMLRDRKDNIFISVSCFETGTRNWKWILKVDREKIKLNFTGILRSENSRHALLPYPLTQLLGLLWWRMMIWYGI